MMPERTSKPKRPHAINQIAASIVEDATSGQPVKQASEPEKPTKNPAAVELGRLGGLKGGKARAAKLSVERRREIAKKAAEARWRREKGG